MTIFHRIYFLLLFFITLLLCFVFSSCSVPVTCILYNNTSTVINITQINNDGSENLFSLTAGGLIKLKGWPLHNYKIAFNKFVWSYDPPLPNYNYVELIGFGPWVKPIVYAQLEKDGRIFLLLKGQKPPTDIMPKQPEGYPLIPEKGTPHMEGINGKPFRGT